MSLSRLVFLINDPDSFLPSGWMNIAIAFLHGVRFDLVAIAYGFIPLWLWLIFIPKKWPKAYNWTFIVLLGLATFANSIDTEFFKFTAKRMTSDIFRFIFLSNDVYHIGPKILFSFWYLVVSWCVINFVSYWLVIRKGVLRPIVHGQRQWIAIVVILTTVPLMMRGGWQKGYPLTVVHASAYGDPGNAILVLNSPFTYLKSIGAQPLINKQFMTDAKALELFHPVVELPRNEAFGQFEGKNVFILIVESLSKEYCGSINGKSEGYTPFLDSLANEGLLHTNAFANGFRSITGIPAIMSSIPSLMYEPIVTSGFSMNDLSGLPEHLAESGYSSYFFHGGNPGTMGFESYGRSAGVQHYLDREDYPDQEHYDGHWGIFDHHFLRFSAKELSKVEQPFVATGFTLSSHHPYTIPNEFAGRFPEGKLDIHASIGYADHSLRKFFDHAKKQPWYENTVFVITTDHTSLTEGGYFSNYAGKLSIPILFFTPADSTLKGRFNEVASQVDIGPSVLHLLGFDKPFVSFGRSIFDPLAPRQSIMFAKHQFQIIEDDKLLRFDGEKSTCLYDLKKDSLLVNNLLQTEVEKVDSLEARLKAYVQQFSTRMYSNRMTAVDD